MALLLVDVAIEIILANFRDRISIHVVSYPVSVVFWPMTKHFEDLLVSEERIFALKCSTTRRSRAASFSKSLMSGDEQW
jgi:hypothetical protein